MAVIECANVLQELRQNSPTMFGLSGALPSIDQLVFLFDMFELSGDVHGLIDFIANVVMADEDVQIHVAPTPPSIGTVPTKCILAVSMLRRYHTCLSLMPEQMARIFRG
jgi:hypothetical protein